jgi:predicted RNase H-like HicB family nuclease
MQKYAAMIHKDDDSAYGVYFPDLIGCFGAGDTEDEALENARISLRMYAEDLIESGRPLPRASTIHELRADMDVRESIDEGGFFVLVPLLFRDKKRRVNVTLEPSLIAAVDEAARVAGTSRSDYLAHAAWRALQEETGAVRVGTKPSRSRKKKRAVKSVGGRALAPA